MKYAITLVMVFVFLNPALSQVRKSQREKIDVYRKYFLNRCLVLGLSNGKVFDGDISATVLDQDAGEIALTTHGNKLDSLAHRFLSTITPFEIADYGGKKPVFMRCLEYYESKKLQKELKAILKSPKLDKL